MAEQTATMTLPMDLIQPAIEAKVNAAVIEALGATGPLIERLVCEIMNRKVSSNGQPSSYSGDNTTPWLSWAVRKAVEGSIQEAITAHIASKQEAIKAAIEAEMKKSKSPLVQSLVTAMATGVAEAVADKYRIKVEFATR